MPSTAKSVEAVVDSTIKMYTQKGARLVWLTKKQLPDSQAWRSLRFSHRKRHTYH